MATGWRFSHRCSTGGLTYSQRAGGEAVADTVARWLDDGIAPNGAHGRAFGDRGVHGFDLTFCAPKSVSLVRALRTDDVVAKAIANAHAAALAEAMEYLADHAGYTRVHNPHTGEKDLVRLPGLTGFSQRLKSFGQDLVVARYMRSCRFAEFVAIRSRPAAPRCMYAAWAAAVSELQ